ncbi:MAG: magnesium transporter CorA family protein [Oscillospiraceae bacterium]|nr:magnesium transporter CorA family protein [Oscillospiraceae bacterium]
MIHFYKSVDNRIQEISELEEGCWVSAVSPDEDEIAFLITDLGLDQGFVRAALDEEESSRIEEEDGQVLVIVDAPVVVSAKERKDESSAHYTTMSMGIILTEKWVVTISPAPLPIISEIEDGMVKNVAPHLRTRFLLLILLRIASRFLLYLKQIDKLSTQAEQQLHRDMSNQALFKLLSLEKSLVYFSTSLKSDEMTLEKIMRGRIIKLYDEDEDILEDVLIEVKQAIEMCNIYSNILSSSMDAFSSIISNNLNIVMKVLTALTIVMAIPNIISGFYGMNVAGLPLPVFWFPLALTVVAILVAVVILSKKGLFR